MKIAIETRYQDKRLELPIERILLGDRIGYDAVFVPEGHGSDCFTPLAYIAAQTTRISLGTCITQIAARSPTCAAMAFQTLDQITGCKNRIIAGLGSSEKTTVEGWHGRRWGSPYWRMRDYVTIMRQAANSAAEPVDHHGREWSIPYDGAEAAGTPPRRSYLDTNPNIPILIGCGNPAMVKLAAEIAEGWFPLGFMPGMLQGYLPLLEEGFARAGGGKSLRNFDIWAHVDVSVHEDVREAMRPFKEYVVEWAELGRVQMAIRGYAGLCDRLVELRSLGRREEAIAAVPDEYIDEGWLVGPYARIAERYRRWEGCGATGLIIRHGPTLTDRPPPEDLEIYRIIARAAGR